MMIEENAEAELHVHVAYEFHDAPVKDAVSFYLADVMDSVIVRSPTVNAIKALTDKVDKLGSHLEKIRRDTEALRTIVDGTGLRISQRTLRALKNPDQLFDPSEFDWRGYKILLGISADEAVSLNHIFWTIDSPAGKRARYEALPQELRGKFEKAFKVSFD